MTVEKTAVQIGDDQEGVWRRESCVTGRHLDTDGGSPRPSHSIRITELNGNLLKVKVFAVYFKKTKVHTD